ncbi:MAG: hypothetical protein OXE85_16035, partial [Roseovarius sp.]|nr:hypothetical protein [Roseovarius sp.]
HVRCRQWKGKFKGLRPVFPRLPRFQAIRARIRPDSPDSGQASPAPGVQTPENGGRGDHGM